ncbi:MAG TPA: monodechloroaminopyrrolnitrin synthase PrnB family protein [Candidatus Saccharimonadales bacterium]|nr:monodechloroaminopyrrolnitrin synthase PrnB family protein [Candidatus Saccharimonadales bacterium]
MSRITNWSSYETIAALDPLIFDEQARRLPSLNSTNDVRGLTDQYESLLDVSARALKEGIDADNAAASLRDLDFVAGSLVRHGAIEIAEQDMAQIVLHSLGAVAGTVPRGTVFTYAAANPDGVRRRTFTDTDGEQLFINSVKEGVDALDHCVEALSEVPTGKIGGIEQAAEHMGRMVTSIVAVKKGITPEFFTYEMRPYFDALTVNGVSYAGAGGAQMQVVAVDRMIWGADCPDATYEDYYADNVRYLTPNQRAAIADFEESTNGKSIVTLINEGTLPPEAAVSTRGLLVTLRKFRYPHRKVANDNFALRTEGSVGSGQYTPTMLDKLIELNEQAIAQIEEKV